MEHYRSVEDPMLEIITKCKSNKYKILYADSNKVVVKRQCLPATIAWEMCSCHGGRIWINQEETCIHIEISSPNYDTYLGVDNPESELAYFIDTRLIEELNSLDSYIYVGEVEGEYSSEAVKIYYFKSPTDMGKSLFHNPVDPFASTFDVITYQPPNPNMKYEYRFLNSDDSKYKFEATKLVRDKCDEWAVAKTHLITCWMYNK